MLRKELKNTQDLVASQETQLSTLHEDYDTTRESLQTEVEHLAAECNKFKIAHNEVVSVSQTQSDKIIQLKDSSASYEEKCANLQVELNEVGLRFENASQGVERLQVNCCAPIVVAHHLMCCCALLISRILFARRGMHEESFYMYFAVVLQVFHCAVMVTWVGGGVNQPRSGHKISYIHTAN